MASKHRKRSRSGTKIATVGAATATVSAMAMTTAPPPQANADSHVGITEAVPNPVLVGGFATALIGGQSSAAPGLPTMELAPGAPDPASIPDLTFGVGARAYDGFQDLAAAFERLILDNVNLSGLLRALGYDPEEIVNNALGTALTQLLAGIPVDLSGVPVVGAFLAGAQIDNALKLTQLIGLNLGDPLNLAGVAAPGLEIITAGPPFSALKFLGVDLGWVPGYPNSVADQVNGTPYLDVGAATILQSLISGIQGNPNLTLAQRLALLAPLQLALATVGDASLVDLRIPVVAGFGLGAFAAGMAYPQIVAQLPSQPGGAQYEGPDTPLAGSVTVLPLILLRNPGRANGGLFARLYPLAALAGIDTVTPDTEVANSHDPDTPPLLQLAGLAIGGANLVPVKVDATVQYDPLSDFPSWFNPVSLLNAGAAAVFPTYILRGLTVNGIVDALTDQASPQLAEALAAVAAGDPLALNLYLTVPADSLPLLEPIRLPVDFLNLVTGLNFNNPVATALEPALKILTNLGFTDVDQDNGYERTLDQADVITPFGTLPSNIDWSRVPGDVFAALLTGLEQAWREGIISSTPVDNPLRTLVNIIGGALGGGSGQAVLPDTPAVEAAAAPAHDQETVEEATPEESAAPDDSGEETRTDLDDSEATARTEAAAEKALEQVDTSVRGALKSLDDIAKKGRHDIRRAARGDDEDDTTQEATDEKSDASDDTSDDTSERASERADKQDTSDAQSESSSTAAA